MRGSAACADNRAASTSGGGSRGPETAGAVNNTLRDVIIQLAARYRLPAIYPLKYYAAGGGLLCYGIDQVDLWPKVAGYADLCEARNRTISRYRRQPSSIW
jgi:hypothetical protein